MTYIPPKTNAWETNKFEGMQLETKNSIEEMIRKSDKLLLVSEFNTEGMN